MAEGKFEKVAEDHPNRCQHNIPAQGQCRNKAVEGGTNCEAHGGPMQRRSTEVKNMQNYRLAKAQLQQKIDGFASSSGIKSLRDEIAILRMLMQEHLDKCSDETDLLLKSHTISELVSKISTVVTACHKLEANMGQHLDKQAILQFATEVITVVSSTLDGDEEKINTIANGIMKVVGRIGESE